MRKLLYYVLTMTLLTGCSGLPKGNEAERLALDIRTDYLEMTSFSADAAMTADYGQRVYQYELSVSVQDNVTTLTLTAPEEVAGITARLEDKSTTLIYEDLSLETGLLNKDGLTPVSSIPALLEAAQSGFLTSCTLEESGRLRMDCGTPDMPIGTGTELTLWFEPDTYTLLEGEVRVDGFRHISCTFSNVTKE